jgi:NAD(P)-dependent dehydrogenase (short-subunit alcohol dehydrogenase family)
MPFRRRASKRLVQSGEVRPSKRERTEKIMNTTQTPLGATSTTDDVLGSMTLRGKRVLVTGVSAGLGVETARSLAARGAEVIGTARDLAKARKATEGIAMQLIELDLASLASVRTCAEALVKDGRRFDVVIANAGVMAAPFGKTVDGFETQFGTNHLGHFVLVNRIAPLLVDGGRVVMVSSSGHRMAEFSLEDPNFVDTKYDPWVAYARSKTANVLFAVEFDRRHRGRGVRATAIHPGGIKTELARHVSDGSLNAMLVQINAARAAEGRPPYQWKTIPQGAATSVWAGFVARAEDVGGRYCEDCHVSEVTAGELAPTSPGVRPYALDPTNAKALWAKSEEMVNESF